MIPILNRNLLYYPIRFARGENLPFHIAEYKRSQYFTRDRLHHHQLALLKQLLVSSFRHVKYYKERFADAGLDIFQLRDLHDLSKYPLLSRHDWMRYAVDLRSDRKFLVLRKKVTGGSTGQPAIAYKNSTATCAEDAAYWRNHSWFGIEPGQKQARFWGVANTSKQKFKNSCIDFVLNRKRISAFNFNKSSLIRYYYQLIEFKPDYFYGYTSLIVAFTQAVMESGLDPARIGIKCIVTTAEPQSEKQKSFLSSTYNKIPVTNDYGSSEIGPIAFMCPKGKMHLMDENLVVEIIGENNRPVSSGEMGEIVVTELNNFSMPMIRYRTGDYGSLSQKPCACGRTLQVLNEIIGRDLNFLKATDGTLVHAMFIYYVIEDMVSKGLGNIQVQAIQTDPKRIVLNIVENDMFDKIYAIRHLIEQLKTRLGADMVFDVHYVNELKREKSGKLFITKNCIEETRRST